MVFEPLPHRTRDGHDRGATNRRWRAWYSHIADEQLRDPKATIAQIAERLQRNPGTIAGIVASDTYRDYFARRRQEFSARHDFAIIHNLQRAGAAAVSALADRLEDPTQLARIKTTDLTETTASVLDRLGFAPPKPATAVNVNVNNGNQVVVPSLTREALEEARAKLRAVEQQKLLEPSSVSRPEGSGSAKRCPEATAPLLLDPSPAVSETEAGAPRVTGGAQTSDRACTTMEGEVLDPPFCSTPTPRLTDL